MVCRYCQSEISMNTERCPHCTSWQHKRLSKDRQWYRLQEGKMIAGVAAGLAEQFDVPLAFVRLLFVLSLLLGGGGIFLYFACWIVMPRADVPVPVVEITR